MVRRHHAKTSAPSPQGGIPSWPRRVATLAALGLCLFLVPEGSRAQTTAQVTLLWTAPGDDGNVGRATSYALRYRTVGITGTDTLAWWSAATIASGLPTPGTAGSTDSVQVQNLTPLTTYYFIIRAADEVPNWSGFSNVAVKSTGGDNTAPAAIADLSVTAATGTSLAIRWTAPGDDGTTGTASSYDIRYSTSAITSTNWSSATTVTGEPAPAAAGGTQTFTLNGLTGSRTYYIAIKTTDDVGNVSALSNVASGTTADTIAPAAVDDLSYESGDDAKRLGPLVAYREVGHEGHAL